MYVTKCNCWTLTSHNLFPVLGKGIELQDKAVRLGSNMLMANSRDSVATWMPPKWHHVQNDRLVYVPDVLAIVRVNVYAGVGPSPIELFIDGRAIRVGDDAIVAAARMFGTPDILVGLEQPSVLLVHRMGSFSASQNSARWLAIDCRGWKPRLEIGSRRNVDTALKAVEQPSYYG